MDTAISEAVKGCYEGGDRGVLEALFTKFGFTTFADKSVAILKAMGVRDEDEVFYSEISEEPNSEEDRYETVIGTFFSGVWVPGAV